MKLIGFLLSIAVMLLFIMGLMMVFDTTSAEIINRLLDRNTHYALVKQILYALVGMAGGWVIYSIGYNAFVQKAPYLLAIATLFLIFVFIPPMGQQINGAYRWVGFGGVSFQPSEFVKYLIPLFYISQIEKSKDPMPMLFFLKLMALLAIPIGLILIEPDNGTVAIILSSLLALFVLSSLKWVYWLLPLCVLIVGGGAVASQMPHVSDRINIYLHPELDLRGKGHQPHQSKIAAGSGQLFGKGLGESLQKLDYLPEARNDYIAAIYAEEFGFAGILVLIFLYMFIAFMGFYIAFQASDSRGFYIAAVFTFLIVFQAFLNLGVVSGLLPSKGTNLPFFSQGGSSLLANCMALFMILSVAKKNDEKKSEIAHV